MDTFFRRHFRLKGAGQSRHKRPGVAVPTSKARRRSSVGLPSAGLVQRRRSSVGLPFTGPVGHRRSSVGLSPTAQAQRRHSSVGLPSGYVGRRFSSVGLACAAHQQRRHSSEVQGGHCCYGGGKLVRTRYYTRRRSSTTVACVNPRFSVRRRQAGKLRTIDTHLLGPSMLLASLVQMSEEQQKGAPEAQRGEGASGEDTESCPSSCCSESEGDSCSQRESSTRSEGSGSEREGTAASSSSYPEGERTWEDWNQAHSMAALTMENIQPRPLSRALRCLRRNSSQLLPAEAVHRSRAVYSVHGRYRHSSQLRRPSTISNSAWPGRLGHPPSRRSSIVACHSSRSLYRNCSACWKPRGRRESLSPLQGIYYDPRLETWSGFVSYVDPPTFAWVTGSVCVCVCV